MIGCRGHWNVIAGHRITLSVILPIFRGRTLIPKILKKFMVINSKYINLCEFFQNFWNLFALGRIKKRLSLKINVVNF